MSHRVTTQTEIKDRDLAIQALKKAGLGYSEVGSNIQITSGRMANATINLDTGLISGDTDYGHNSETLGMLRQAYGEAKYVRECNKQGVMIEGRNVEKNGDIVLMWATG